MNAQALINDLRGRGVLLNAAGDRLQVDAPQGVLDDDTRQLIRTHKLELLALLVEQSTPPAANDSGDGLDAEARTERQPFDQKHLDAIKAGYAVHVWSGVLNEWLWWVRDETVKTKLAEKQDIDRGLIYTLGELAVVVATGKTADDVRNMHATKKQFDGVIHHANDKPLA